MEIDEEYIDKVQGLIEQKDTESVKALLADLHPADIAELCNDLDVEEARFIPERTCWKPCLRKPSPRSSWTIWTRTMPWT